MVDHGSPDVAGTLFVFFRWNRAHRVLHSFPTRRSSDLASLALGREGATSSAALQDLVKRLKPPRVVRSEEHTSELQSQSNLVCRLLLEKKNILHHQTPCWLCSS